MEAILYGEKAVTGCNYCLLFTGCSGIVCSLPSKETMPSTIVMRHSIAHFTLPQTVFYGRNDLGHLFPT